jgi:copper resistance protein B
MTNLNNSITRLALAVLCIGGALFLSNSKTSAQQDMAGMPGMSPTPTRTPLPSPAAANNDMESMPGMTPPAKGSSPVPKKEDMSGMPGMSGSDATSKAKATESMPGMSPGGASTPQRMSAPGVFTLRPPQKWTPPPGDDRRDELMSREALQQHMEPLPAPIAQNQLHSLPLFDLLESRYNSSGPDMLVWDFVGWFGGDYNRLWVKTEGRQALSQRSRGEGDLQLLYGRLISPYWDFQIGARTLTNLGNGSFRRNARTYAVIGFQGLAPGNFDVEPALYISDRGEVSGEITITADVYLTQCLIIQPRFQGEITVQGDPRFDTGSGGSTIDMGVRLRYDIRREIQPYIGVSWLRSFGANARLAREAGETNDTIGLVVGMQLWW